MGMRGGPKSKISICMHISYYHTDFLKICISQRSVATQLRCGVIFSKRVTADFPQNATLEEF